MTSAVKTSDYYYAQNFTPVRNVITQISLYLQKVGSPPDPLEGAVYADDGSSKPNPAVKIAGFSFDPEYVTATAGWFGIACTGNLIPGSKYWVVLKMNGDAGNYYLWYHDGLATGSHCFSSDNVTYTVVSSSFKLSFKTQYDVRLLVSKEDATTVPVYEWRETVYRDESIIDRVTANAYAAEVLALLKDEAPELSDITILEPASIPLENTFVTVAFAAIDVAGDYDVTGVRLVWNAFQVGTRSMDLSLGKHGVSLAEFLAGMKADIDRGKAVDIVGDIVDITRTLTDTCTLTSADNVVAALSTLTFYVQDEFVSVANWTPDSGSWSVLTGDLYQAQQDSGYKFSNRWTGTPIPVADYYAETRIKINSFMGEGRWGNVAYAGIVCRGQNAVLEDGLYYFVEVNTYFKRLRLIKHDPAVGNTILVYASVQFKSDVYYKLRLFQRDVGANWQCTVWVDDHQYIDYLETPRSINGTGMLWLSTHLYSGLGTQQFDYCRVWSEVPD